MRIAECKKQNLCIDCEDENCFLARKIESDCPKHTCLNYDCKNCDFIKDYQKTMRAEYEKTTVISSFETISIIEKHKDNIKDITNQCYQKHQLIHQKYDDIVLQADIYTDNDKLENGQSIQIAIFKNNIAIVVLYETIQDCNLTEKTHIQPDDLTLVLPVPFDTIVYTVDENTSGEYEIFDWTFSGVNKTNYVLTSLFSEIEIPHNTFYEHVYLDKDKAGEKLQELTAKPKTEEDKITNNTTERKITQQNQH